MKGSLKQDMKRICTCKQDLPKETSKSFQDILGGHINSLLFIILKNDYQAHSIHIPYQPQTWLKFPFSGHDKARGRLTVVLSISTKPIGGRQKEKYFLDNDYMRKYLKYHFTTCLNSKRKTEHYFFLLIMQLMEL